MKRSAIEVPHEDYFYLKGKKVHWKKGKDGGQDADSLDCLVRGEDGTVRWPKKLGYYTNWLYKQDALDVMERAIGEWPVFLRKVKNGTWHGLSGCSAHCLGMDITDIWRSSYGCVLEERTLKTRVCGREIRLPKPEHMTFEDSILYKYTLRGMCEDPINRRTFEASLRDSREY